MTARTRRTIPALAAAVLVLVGGCASSIAGSPGIDPAAASVLSAPSTPTATSLTTPDASSSVPPPSSTVPTAPSTATTAPSTATNTPIRPIPPVATGQPNTTGPNTTGPNTTGPPTTGPPTTGPTKPVATGSAAGSVHGIAIDDVAAALREDPVAVDDDARAAADPKALKNLDTKVVGARKAGLDVWVVLIGHDVDKLTQVSDAIAVAVGGTVIVVAKSSFAVTSKQFSSAQLKQAEHAATSATSAVQAASVLVDQFRGMAASSAPTATKTGGSDLGASLTQFQLADHSIGCAIIDKIVRCDLQIKPGYTPPKNPHPDCQGVYGSSIQMPPDKAAAFICVSDTVYDPASPVLKDGAVDTVGEIMCFADGPEVTCLNLTSVHGFSLSKKEYDTF